MSRPAALVLAFALVACGAEVQRPDDSPDAAVAPDLTVAVDAADPPDQAAPPDLAPRADLARPPDLAPPPDMTSYQFTYFWEFDNSMCPTAPKMGGTKNPGEACADALACKGTCCACTVGTRTYWAGACINGKCADVATTCSLVAMYKPEVCK